MKPHVGAGVRRLAVLALACAALAVACGGDDQLVAVPTASSQTPAPTGSLAEVEATTAHLNTDGWIAARSPEVALTATIPPSYSAAFRLRDLAIGEGKVHELIISNSAAASRPPLEEGAEPPPGEVTLTVQLYPSGPIVPAQRSDWIVVERASFELPAAKEPIAITHYLSPDGRQQVVLLQGKYELPDGRVLDVLGRVTSPERAEDIQTLVRIAGLIRISLTGALHPDEKFDFSALPAISEADWQAYTVPNGTLTFRAPATWDVTVGAASASSDPSVGDVVDIRKPGSTGLAVAPGVTVSGWVEVAISTQPFEVPFALAGFETTVRALTLPGARTAATKASPDRISVLQLKGSSAAPRYHGALIFTTPSFRPKSLYLNTIGVVHFDADPVDVATVIAIIESIEVLR